MSDDVDARLRAIADRVRVVKVAASRSVKGRHGDHYAAFAARYNSVQDEAAGPEKDLLGGEAEPGMRLDEARVAHYLVSMQADIAAHEAVWASGGISAEELRDLVRALRTRYGRLIRVALGVETSLQGET